MAESRGWYSPRWHYDNEPETRAALDLIFANHFSRHEPGIFEPLRETLLTHGDHYMHLADLMAYLEADRRLLELYAEPEDWAHKTIKNLAASGRFSSDRTIAEYAAEIWHATPCAVSCAAILRAWRCSWGWYSTPAQARCRSLTTSCVSKAACPK